MKVWCGKDNVNSVGGLKVMASQNIAIRSSDGNW